MCDVVTVLETHNKQPEDSLQQNRYIYLLCVIMTLTGLIQAVISRSEVLLYRPKDKAAPARPGAGNAGGSSLRVTGEHCFLLTSFKNTLRMVAAVPTLDLKIPSTPKRQKKPQWQRGSAAKPCDGRRGCLLPTELLSGAPGEPAPCCFHGTG